MATKKSDATAEIAVTDWTTVRTWDDAMAMSSQVVAASEVFGDGAQLVKKEDIVGKGDFLILEWREVLDKATLNEYVSVLAMNRGNEKFRFNDGSTGIAKQLREFGQLAPGQTVYVREMTVSEYTTEINGKQIQAKTYYLA